MNHRAMILITLALIAPINAGAEQINFNRLADSIYIAEGGSNTRHPYGIIPVYKHTTPRQACLNTIKHQYRNWIAAGMPGEFIAYLGSKYAPVNCDNDNGTNKYWVNNVRDIYAKRS